MDYDKPTPSVANVATIINIDIFIPANQSTQIAITTPVSAINTPSITTIPIVVSTPFYQQPQPPSIPASSKPEGKLFSATNKARRKEKEEKDHLRLEKSAKKDTNFLLSNSFLHISQVSP